MVHQKSKICSANREHKKVAQWSAINPMKGGPDGRVIGFLVNTYIILGTSGHHVEHTLLRRHIM